MYNNYYYSDQFSEPIYLSVITINKAVETTLYVGSKLVLRKSLYLGSAEVFRKDNLLLNIQLKWFKVILNLQRDGEPVALDKLSRKELRMKLQALNIHNELNPNSEAEPPLEYQYLKTPLILLAAGLIWDFLTSGRGGLSDIPAMILLVIAYYQIFSPLIDRVSDRYMDVDTKSKFKLLAGLAGMILTQILIDKLI